MYSKAIEESTSLKIRIANGQSETVNQRTDNTMAKRKRKTNTTTISHTLLKSRIKKLIRRCFSKKNGEQRYQYIDIGRDKSYFVKSHSKSNNRYKQDEIIQMLNF